MAELKETKETKEVKGKKPVQPKKPQEDKSSRVMAILKKEYAFENWLLAILSPILVLYGVYIILGKFGGVSLGLGTSGIGFIDFFFSTTLKRVLTGTFLILIGALVIVYLVLPILKPSLSEMKKVTWPTSKSLAKNTSRVFAFLVFLMIVFTLYGYLLDPIFKWLYSL